ncbi:hypothetical protein ACFR9U_09620 [Halorientalis brevis]|uniref:ACT domain-containing protein n=1 Tax=Halorientalis brevis TaxID=1126241 RepID=A0ABD6CBD2_9EURY|nr:hypothetical protein [Halorientalis brevis]
MSLAERTREAVRANPFLYEALRAGVVNYTAAARFLDLGVDDQEAVVAALRRYAEDLPEYDATGRDARVNMESGVGVAEDADQADALLTVGETRLVSGGGSLTAILAGGDVDARSLGHVLTHLGAEGIDVEAAGTASDALTVVVSRRAGPDALRAVEAALETVPDRS